MKSRDLWRTISQLEKQAKKGSIPPLELERRQEQLFLQLDLLPHVPALQVETNSRTQDIALQTRDLRGATFPEQPPRSARALQKNLQTRPISPRPKGDQDLDQWGDLSIQPYLSSISMDDLQEVPQEPVAVRTHPTVSKISNSSHGSLSSAPSLRGNIHNEEEPAPFTSRNITLIEPGLVLRDRYRLDRQLGSGGMGRVFLTEDIKYGGHYALKALHPWVLQNKEVTRRFIQEFKFTEQLSHPGIVRTFTLDEDPTTTCLFYTMEYVQGVTLQSIIESSLMRKKGPPLRLSETHSFIKKLAKILDYAHRKRVIHRDLKPANIILVDGRDNLKLVDFGIAKALATHPTYHTGHGGTFYYIAPEQLVGGEEVTPAADIFSLGVLLYQLLTGEIPVAMAVPPSELNELLDKDVDLVIRKAIHPRPTQRYQSVNDLMQALDTALLPLVKASKNTQPPPNTPNPELTGPLRPRQKSSLTAPLRPPLPRPQSSRPQQAPPTPPPTLRPNRLEKISSVFTLKAHQNAVRTIAFSPDGRLLASGSEDNTLKIWESSSWFLLHTFTDHTSPLNALRWSPDGRFVISASADHTVKVWDVFSARLFHLFQHDSSVNTVEFGIGGKQVISGSQDGNIRVWDIETGRKLKLLEGHTAPIRSISIHPTSGLLVSGSEDTTIKLWALDNGQLLHTFEEYWTIVNAVCFCPTPHLFASATDDASLKLWDLNSNQVGETLRGHKKSITSLSTAPNGSFLASGARDETIRVWSLPDGKPLQTFQHDETPVLSICTHPNSLRLASGAEDGTIKVWELTPTQEALF